jgi:hypothetical protein
VEKRIERIETQLDRHSLHLNKIQLTIDQVKWMAAGMIAFYALTELGFLNAVKMGF